MRAIAVDDELYMLESLEEAVRASADISHVERFSTCSAAYVSAAEQEEKVSVCAMSGDALTASCSASSI